MESGVLILIVGTYSVGWPCWNLFVLFGEESGSDYHTSIGIGLVGGSVVDVIQLRL